MENFVVRAELGSTVIVRDWLTLDALLAALIFEQTRDINRAHSEIPLANTGGVWHGSAALFEDSRPAHVPFTAALRADHDLDPSKIGRNRDGNLPTVGTKRRREFGNLLNVYQAKAARAIWWHGRGDVDKVGRLLRDVASVGKKRRSGYGAATDWDIGTGGSGGLMHDGRPMRPVPSGVWTGEPDAIIGDDAWRPAYWDAKNRTACAVPDCVDYDREKLQAML
jgi:hypothetical protein